jgi:hypothetical protein
MRLQPELIIYLSQKREDLVKSFFSSQSMSAKERVRLIEIFSIGMMWDENIAGLINSMLLFEIEESASNMSLDYAHAFDIYTKQFGMTNALLHLCDRLNVHENLQGLKDRRHLYGYKRIGFEFDIIQRAKEKQVVDDIIPRNQPFWLKAIALLIVVIGVTWLFTTIFETNIEAYKEDRKKSSQFKLFEMMAKENK